MPRRIERILKMWSHGVVSDKFQWYVILGYGCLCLIMKTLATIVNDFHGPRTTLRATQMMEKRHQAFFLPAWRSLRTNPFREGSHLRNIISRMEFLFLTGTLNPTVLTTVLTCGLAMGDGSRLAAYQHGKTSINITVLHDCYSVVHFGFDLFRNKLDVVELREARSGKDSYGSGGRDLWQTNLRSSVRYSMKKNISLSRGIKIWFEARKNSTSI